MTYDSTYDSGNSPGNTGYPGGNTGNNSGYPGGTTGGSTISGYPGGAYPGSVSAGNGFYYSSSSSAYSNSNGSVTEKSNSTCSVYYKWTYIGGTPPAAGAPGANPSAGPISLLVHTNLSASASLSSPISGLSATATISDSLASSDQVSQNAPALDTYHLVQAGIGSNGIASFSFTGASTMSASNSVAYGTTSSNGYPTTTNGPASASARTYLTAGSRLFTASLQAAATGQPLSTAPAYFCGPNCSVQANAQPIGGTVTDVKILVNGSVILDSPGNQTTVMASFDALGYPEGYVLPITMQVWDSTGHHYDSTLKAPVHLPQVHFYDLWTPDYTVAPVNGQVPLAAASTGSTIGGNTTLHLRSQYGGGLSLLEVRLHLDRDTDSSKDIVWANPVLASPGLLLPGPPAVYSLWDARCGDPDPSLPGSVPSQYVNGSWNVGGRNGVYDVTATFTAAGAGGVVHVLTTPAATFDREDLLITQTNPVNPKPLLWNPSVSTSLPVSATFTCAYKATGTAILQIYTTDNNITPIRTLTTGFTTKDGSVSLTWDGTADPVNGQPGEPQDKGVYLFQWKLTDTLKVVDTDKSQNLNISAPNPYATIVSDDGTTAVYQVSYTLASLDSPVRSASIGKIDVFDPLSANIFSLQLGIGDMTPGTHTITLIMPSTDLGPSIFLISAADADSDTDRASLGRQRYALQHNNWQLPDKTIAFYYSGGSLGGAILPDTRPQANGFIAGMGTLGYKRLPGYTYQGLNLDGDGAYDWLYGDPNVNDIGGTRDNTKPITSSNKRTGALNVDWKHRKLLRTVLFAGHGSDDGAVLLLRGPLGLTPSSSQQTYLVSTQSYYDAQKAAGTTYLSNAQTPTKSMILDSMVWPAVSGQRSLDNLDLVVVSGCSQASSTGTATTIGQEFLVLGAQCVVLVGSPNQDGNNSGAWIDGIQAKGATQTVGFVGYLAKKNGKVPKYTIQQASDLAKADVDAFNQEHGNSQFDQWTNHSSALAVTVLGPKWNAPLMMHN